jgi:hypothetical protein
LNGFLLDENLPQGLMFVPSLPITHSSSLGVSPSDTHLWEHARAHRLVIAKMWPQVEALLPAHKLVCIYSDRIESFRD